MSKNEDFKDHLIKKMKEKDLAETSINFYLRNLKKLNDDKPIENLNFLSNKKKVMKFILSKKPNTQRNYYISLVSTLRTDPTKKTLQKFYQGHMDSMNKTLKEKESSNEKTETQKNNWIPHEEIQNIYNDLEKHVNEFKDKINLSESEYKVLLKYVVLSLYILIPPRRNKDYKDAYIIKGIKEKDLDNKENYIDITNKKFIFNNFKTAKTEGQQKIDIPDNLLNVLNIYVKHHPLLEENEKTFDVPFLVNYKGIPLDSVNAITVILNKIFPKKIGSSMLRHMYLSNKYGDILKEQQKDAKMMAHSTTMQKDYIKK